LSTEISINSHLLPVSESERIQTLDVLRGIALLGILVVNIEVFALPNGVFFDPRLAGGFEGANQFVWKWSTVFFFEKMMAIFSMLFGAGIVLFCAKGEAAGIKPAKTYYRRILGLLLVGLIHAYFFWYGDILVPYALTALILYLFRRRSAKALIIVGVVFLVFGSLIQFAAGLQFSWMRSSAEEYRAAEASGKTTSDLTKELAKAWDQISAQFLQSEETIEKETAAYRGSYLDGLRMRAPLSLMMQTQAFLFIMIWRIGGLMLLGMGLMKLGYFTAKLSARTYLIVAIVGYVIGLPLCILGVYSLQADNFDIVKRFQQDAHFNYFGSLFLALAYSATLILLHRAGYFAHPFARLASVGRMAFSNYLLQTLLCTTLFYGYAFGMFNYIERVYFPLIILIVWTIQLVISPWWLRRFRFGPAEWLWRTFTYRRRQPMRISTTDTAV
jgi:uncharacterized protein